MIKTLQGFKDFIMRGNVIDLAVGIVIGAAFTALVTSFTKSFIEPLLKLLGAGDPRTAGAWTVGGQSFTWATFLNALVTFVLTAAVLYFFVVLPMNRLAHRRRAGEEPEPRTPSEEILLLQQIRDALVAGAAVTRRDGGEPAPAPAPAPRGPGGDR